jgi:hypothetical protein
MGAILEETTGIALLLIEVKKQFYSIRVMQFFVKL